MSAKPYINKMTINHQNKKGSGSQIVNLDTSRGCQNNCESCFAKKNCRKGEVFKVVVPVKEFTSKIKENLWYRFGNFGDPAYDWKHTQKLIKKYNFKNFFMVTKLQNIKGFDGTMKNIQVSIDPLNKIHMSITLKNIKTIIKTFPNTKIVARIRSLSTKDFTIRSLQKKAVDFCNTFNIPILETRVRFSRYKEAILKYNLNTENYSLRKGYFKPNKGTIFLSKVNDHHVCDIKELNCEGCNKCVTLFNNKVAKLKLAA